MRRFLGTALIVISVICILATLFLIVWGIIHPPQHPSQDRRQMEAITFAIIIGFLVIFEIILIIAGLYLRRSSKPKLKVEAGARGKRRLLPLAVYLGGSICIAMLGSLAFLRYINIGPLWLLVCPPSILIQLTGAPFGFKMSQNLTGNMLLVIFHIVYFTAMFFPVYRIVTLDRAREIARVKLMKTILILFCGLHLLVVLFLMVVSRA